ncbi:MAG: DUF6616 family protein [Candidatus Bathyarchaeia archaeon]|jgi:hypothetical protein
MNGNSESRPLGWIKFWKPKDDWYGLNAEARKNYYDKYKELVDRIEGKGAILIGTYRCRGQSRWERFEFWEFPSIDLLIAFSNELESINHYLYFEENAKVGRKYKRLYNPNTWVT